MTDWFEWNGHRCTEYGIHVSEHPPLTLPAERSTFTSVPGRSGTLTLLEDEDVYDDMLLTCTCFIENTERLTEIAAWLRGSGTVTFANRQGGFYYARVVDQISFEKILRGPQSPGGIASEPVVKVMLTGDAEITIGSSLFSLTGVTGTVTIDTPKLEYYQDNTSKIAIHKGHTYATCAMDLETGEVLWVGKGRSKDDYRHGWLRIQSGTMTGWCAASYLTRVVSDENQSTDGGKGYSVIITDSECNKFKPVGTFSVKVVEN